MPKIGKSGLTMKSDKINAVADMGDHFQITTAGNRELKVEKTPIDATLGTKLSAFFTGSVDVKPGDSIGFAVDRNDTIRGANVSFHRNDKQYATCPVKM